MTISLQEKKKITGAAAPKNSIASAGNFIGPIKLKPLSAVEPTGTARSAVNSTTTTSADKPTA